MSDIKNANWIKAPYENDGTAICFCKSFNTKKDVKKAAITLTSIGTFTAYINGRRIGNDILTPGWTDYYNRIQYFTYDITSDIKAENSLSVEVGKGWFFHSWYKLTLCGDKMNRTAIIAAIDIEYTDGTSDMIYTDDSWTVKETNVRYNNIYNGETVDYNFIPEKSDNACIIDRPKSILIPKEGVSVLEQETFKGETLIITPKGETVIDFGQEVTGYVTFDFKGEKGDKITLKHFEMLDSDGNVYTENYRGAKSEFTVICDGEKHTAKPKFTFYGFRYIHVTGMKVSDPAVFTAIAVYSDIKKTASITTSSELLNKLYSNICWGQRGNFLDIPTDCPQRDERLGWTGDAQVFCKTAAFNFDVYEFFRKWCGDLRSNQRDNGEIPDYVPSNINDWGGSAAWADCATIIPWQIYRTYGKKQILEENIGLMKKWVDYLETTAREGTHYDDEPKKGSIYLKNTGHHFGDWLSLDLGDKEATAGATDDSLIATAFFCYSTSLYIKACEVLGTRCEHYKELYKNVRKAFIDEYVNDDGTLTSDTQTAYVLALHFDLTPDRKTAAKRLVELLHSFGHHTTGFVGTPYLLHVLSSIGENKLAYDLLLREEYPSWLYTVKAGGTTMWERWNGRWPDGHFANPAMNSFNHYAYGAVGDWMFEKCAGINQTDDSVGYKKIVLSPVTDDRLTHFKASFDSINGTITSEWTKTDGKTEYIFTVPENAEATAVLDGKTYNLNTGVNKISL